MQQAGLPTKILNDDEDMAEPATPSSNKAIASASLSAVTVAPASTSISTS
eukprot:CAMPEP_0178423608 /NCGR_PEP_ID=MMETSP0689_2-20121128/27776_1 /TAXON_ID=160604 /ORGANISM="Amphidinium massartii, Strain CS-259" /LENGTH=49 /DNA_ID=CAMNT_0020045207 /DNA_START=295 /DNA_END=445 /DNA_ORIENTATION=-